MDRPLIHGGSIVTLNQDGMTAYDQPTDEESFTENDEVEGEEIDFERETGSSLRTKLTDALSRIKELEEANEIKTEAIHGKEMDDAFKASGLERDQGLGKAIALAYDGPPDADALATHLEGEYGYIRSGEPHPLADQITLAQAQLDSVAATAGSAPFVTPWDEELAKAEAVGDYDKALNMKGAQLGQMFRP